LGTLLALAAEEDDVTVAMQLTIDGGEVEYRHASSRAPLGPAQREVMRLLGFGSLTSTQAGSIVHGLRGSCGFGAKDTGREYRGAGCCRYAVTDGSAVMRRLYDRGFVEKHSGLWFAKS
jgi:hypothetical protein